MARAWIRRSLLSTALVACLTLPHSALAQAQAPVPPVAQPLPPGAQPGVPPVAPGAQPAPVPEDPPAAPPPGQPVAPEEYAPAQPATPPGAYDMVQPFSAEPPPLESAPPPVSPPLMPFEEPEEEAWYDSFVFGAFADAYFGVDFNFPKGRAYKPIRAYDFNDGFSLSWVGLDVEKAPEPVGGVISLRFGPTAQRLAGACVDGECDNEYGLSAVKQGYVSWKPGGADGAVRLDLGKFDTPYGAEVAESQYNLNYTRGALYWLGQPAYHTGLRFTADLDRMFALKLLAVNGWNRSVDNNLGKSFGLQGALRVPAADGSDDDVLTVSLGYMVGPEWDDFVEISCPPGTRPDASEADGCETDPDGEGGMLVVDRGGANTEGLRHFLDLTLAAAPSPQVNLSLNASLGIDNQRSEENLAEFETKLWWGVAAAGRYALDDRAGIAARGEYYLDRDGYTTGFAPVEISLLTGTLTFDYSPDQAVKLFVDGRVDWSNRQIFPKQVRELVGTAVSVTVGAVVMTY